MTMPVFTLLTPAAAPQTVIGGQSVLKEYSEGQQQSYSEDLAALLASMDAALVALDSEMQQLTEGAVSQAENQDLVQSMMPQPLLFDPLLPAETADATAEMPPAVETPLILTDLVIEEQAGVNSSLVLVAENAAEVQLLSSLSVVYSSPSGLLPPASQQPGTLSGTQALLLPASVQPETVPALVAIRYELQQTTAPAAEHSASLVSALNQLPQSTQNTTLGSALIFNPQTIAAANQSKTAGLHQVMADILSPVTAVAPVPGVASSALPVWQADPLPAQSQHWGQRLVQMLADKVDLQLGLNVKSAMIRLDPPSLGSIELSVQLDGDRLTVQMHSSNAQLREAMGQGLDQLRASLQQKLGADVQIDLRMGSDSSSQQQQQKARQQLAQQTELNFHSEPEMTATESSQPNRLNLVNQLV